MIQAYERLEQKFGQWSGCLNPNTVACSSGSSALHLAIESLDLPLGSEILVPDYTMVACARAVTLAGMVPVFIDCRNALLADTSLLKELWYPQYDIKAVMVVHIYGRRSQVESLHSFLDGRPIPVIEDMAELHGVAPHPKTTAACWSFYRNKLIAGEEGGMISFKDPSAAAKARQLRSLGFTEGHDFLHVPRGHNYRLANALAKIVEKSLDSFGSNLYMRRHVEGWYNESIPESVQMPYRDSPWVYDVRVKGADYSDIGKIVRRLNEQGISARFGFKPMSIQPEYRECRLITGGESQAQRIAPEIMYLPITPLITHEETCKTARAFLDCLDLI